MGRLTESRGLGILLIVIAVFATACNDTRPTPDAFDPTTTTTTVLGGGETPNLTPPTLPPPEEQITAQVLSITDGDTIKVRIDGQDADLRLLGINAPEQDECWASEATAKLAGMLEGQRVVLTSGEEDTDQFGRLLRYVYLDTSGEPLFVNAEMVSDGNAIGLTNGHEFARAFKALEAAAFQSGTGMWGTFVCGDAEGTSADRPVIRVSDVEYDPDGPDDDNLDQEFVTIVNEGYGRVAMAGWVLRDESSVHRFTFPQDVLLTPGDSVTVVTGCSGGPTNAIHWCNDGAIWSNAGDTVIVSDTLGNAVIWFWYDSKPDGN